VNKLLVFSARFVLTAAFLIPASYASAINHNSTIPYINGSTLFPTARWAPVRYTFRINVPSNSKAVSQLIIKVPDVITVTSNKQVDIADTNGRKINAQVSVSGQNIFISFPETVSASTQLEIDVNNIKQPILGNGPVYRLSVKFVGSNVEVPIGVAIFRTNL
jgi:hypothetical protein